MQTLPDDGRAHGKQSYRAQPIEACASRADTTSRYPGDVRIIQFNRLTDEVSGIAEIVRQMVDDGASPGDIVTLAQRGVIETPIHETLHGHNVPVRSCYAEAELDADDAQRRFSLLKLFVDRGV